MIDNTTWYPRYFVHLALVLSYSGCSMFDFSHVARMLNLRKTSTGVHCTTALRITGTWMAIFGGSPFPFVLSFKAAGPCFACLSVRIFLTNLFCIHYIRVNGGRRARKNVRARASTFEHVRERKSTRSLGIARNDEQTENLEPQYSSTGVLASSTGTLLPESTIYVQGPGSLTVVTGS